MASSEGALAGVELSSGCASYGWCSCWWEGAWAYVLSGCKVFGAKVAGSGGSSLFCCGGCCSVVGVLCGQPMARAGVRCCSGLGYAG